MTKKERRELCEQLDDHRGEWVAIRDGTVVAAAKTIAELNRDVEGPVDRRLAVPARHGEPYLRR